MSKFSWSKFTLSKFTPAMPKRSKPSFAKSKSWWAHSGQGAHRAAVGGILAVATLATAGYLIWTSPANPVNAAIGAAEAISRQITDPRLEELQAENVLLTSKVTGLRHEVATRDQALKAKYGTSLPPGIRQIVYGQPPVLSSDDTPGTEGTDPERADTADPVVAPVASPQPSEPSPTATAVPAPSPSPKPASPPLAPGESIVVPPAVQHPSVPIPTATPLPAASSAPAATPSATSPKPTTSPAVTTSPTPTPSAPTPSPTPTVEAPTLAALAAPEDRYFGLYTEQAPFNWATFDAAATKLETAPSMVGYFGGWDEAFRPEAVKRAWAKNMLPMLTWESRPIEAKNNVVDEPDYTLPTILGDPENGVDGAFDDYLRQYAKDIVANDLPLAIRFDHEMNGIWYPWAESNSRLESLNGNRPGDFVKVWQHVHDIFEEEGANELVLWVWSPNIINNLPATHKPLEYLQSLYPGDEYVDWVGVSGYLRPAYKAENDFSFDYTFGATLDQLRLIAPGKPIILAEVGASETGGHKVAWLESLFDALADPANADVIGLAWFNLAVSTYTEGELGTNDWRVDSRPEALAAFREGLARVDTDFGPIAMPIPVLPQ